MRVLYSAVDVSVPAFHGGSTHVEETVNALLELGHKVLLVSMRGKGQPLTEKKGNLSIYRIPVFFRHGFPKILNFMLFSKWLILYLLFFKRIDLVYERNRVFGNLGVFLGWIFGKKCILEMNEPLVQVAEHDFGHSPMFSLIKGWFYLTAKRADVITVTHKCMALGLPKEKILKIHYGANPKKFFPKKKDAGIVKKFGLKNGKTIFYSGSFRRWHALSEIIKTAEILKKKDPAMKFLLAGKGEMFSEAQEMVREKKLEGNVFLLGFVPAKKMNDYINACDMCVALFSKNYPLFKKCSYFYSALKVHEYKACGKPVIATDLGNLREIVRKGKNGLLVDNNPNEIASAIVKLSRNESMRGKMGKLNRGEIVEHYNWKDITRRVLESAAP